MRVVHPVSAALVDRLARTRIEPWHVVVAHSAIGAGAAALLAGDARWGLVSAAVLLQVKTVLDNADGGLARATGRVTELGRYLDTGLDLVVNVLLFVALAQHGPLPLALVALVVLTVVLSYDFNAEALYRAAQADERVVPGSKNGLSIRSSFALTLFRGLYQAVLAPQDRAIRRLDAALFARASGLDYASAPTDARREWSNVASTGALVNLGLSTQYLALGVCAALGSPFAYVYVVLAQGVYLVALQTTRVATARRAAAVGR
ncbi:MAG TPA: CDP-alcohol phosphatidyltransferase family protein [Trueperaceae bacterium]|nr:CDP-alcohol phosphatidyltransferase family protein [Trueperaceae bacterium]